jgi:aryl-alcohol dehydrogenase-like predicted oxidoreductase
MSTPRIPTRRYRDAVELSVVGFGGMIAVGMEQPAVDALVERAFVCGVNYFDVAPLYGRGEAEVKLGNALSSVRDKVFLASKTLERSAGGAAKDLALSLRRLRTDRLDLYQFHSVGKKAELEEIWSPGGAAEIVLRARNEGIVRYVGFSSHSVPLALEMLERFAFDSVLFPVNFVCWFAGEFGPQVLDEAARRGVACIGLKAMAHGAWQKGELRSYPNCWYRPISDPGLACKALRFALSRQVTAVLPPGDARLFTAVLDRATELEPLDAAGEAELAAMSRTLKPLLHA